MSNSKTVLFRPSQVNPFSKYTERRLAEREDLVEKIHLADRWNHLPLRCCSTTEVPSEGPNT